MVQTSTGTRPDEKADVRRLTVDVPEAARMLGIGRNSLYDAIRRGDVPALVIGRRVLVPTAALEQLLSGMGLR